MSKYQETLNFIENVVIDELSNGYDEPRYFRDFYPGVIRVMQELVDKEIELKPIFNKLYDSYLHGTREETDEVITKLVTKIEDWSNE